MRAGPGDETAGAEDRGRLRASHADREQVIELLKTAFAQGRLSKDEFDQRVGQVLTSLTYAGLAALKAVLPPGPARAEPTPEPGSHWAGDPARISRDKKILRIWAGVIIACPSFVAAVASAEGGTARIAVTLLVVILFTCLVAVPVSGLVMLHSWYGEARD